MSYLWPLGSQARWPAYRREQEHIADNEPAAWDMGAQEGIPIYASADGVIVEAFAHALAGYSVVLEGAGYRFHFCHGQALEVSVGRWVKRGEIIGHVGHTGWTIPAGPEGSHLHFWLEQWAD